MQDLLEALHSLGISPTEQEVVDMQCEMEKKGKIFFPDFCKLCQRKFREFDDEMFRQELFKVIFSMKICIKEIISMADQFEKCLKSFTRLGCDDPGSGRQTTNERLMSRKESASLPNDFNKTCSPSQE